VWKLLSSPTSSRSSPQNMLLWLGLVACGSVEHVSLNTASNRKAVVQLGNNRPGSLHATWEKWVHIGNHRTKASCDLQHPSRAGTHGLVESVSISGSLMDVSYEATRTLNEDATGTDMQFAYALPTGLQVMADAHVAKDAPEGNPGGVQLTRMSAFHTAGPFNLQSSWLCGPKTLQLKLGRGAMFRRCPVSFQADIPAGGTGTRNFEVGMRQELGGGRRMRGRLLLPAETSMRSVWCEVEDTAISKSGVWIAKATLPLVQASAQAAGKGVMAAVLDRVDLSLRMATHW